MKNFELFLKRTETEDSVILENRLIIITKADANGNNKMICYNDKLELVWEVPAMIKNCPFVGFSINKIYSVVDFNGKRNWFKIENGEIYSSDFVK